MPSTVRPRQSDTKCPDGFTCYGWRRVNKGGYVRFSHGQHFHDKLKELVGAWVYVTLADMWGSNVDVWLDKPFVGESLACTNPALEAAEKAQSERNKCQAEAADREWDAQPGWPFPAP